MALGQVVGTRRLQAASQRLLEECDWSRGRREPLRAVREEERGKLGEVRGSDHPRGSGPLGEPATLGLRPAPRLSPGH